MQQLPFPSQTRLGSPSLLDYDEDAKISFDLYPSQTRLGSPSLLDQSYLITTWRGIQVSNPTGLS